ncbi:ionotropic receptor 93a-like [Centruroides sculpturatus]|uniref:ionotropic receptor 93a-like n=1 Tax=Centruroides sculpturatus TaxID=218467 RepID=UPI000C6DCC98|nr:ionotropic receptor 93a-like [Centruroides sculpturatus]
MKGTNLNNTTNYASRLSIGICLLSISVLGFGYSGTLISFLTTPSYQPAPRSINELATAGNKSTDIEILRSYLERNPDTLLSDPSAIATKIENERYAFIASEFYLRAKVIPLFHGRSTLSEENFRIFITGYLLRKDFPYKRAVNKIITRLFEAGIVKRITEKEYLPLHEGKDEVHPLKLEELVGSFVVLVIGYTLSLLCFISELIIGYYANSNRN